MKKALFLDRDGVININNGYVYKPEEFEFTQGIFDLCRDARDFGYLIFVVTNQSGIGRGYYTEADFHRLTDWMLTMFRDQGIEIAKVYYCPYHPVHGIGRYKVDSLDRKPGPGMFLAAAEEFGVDLSESVLIGDSDTDIQAGITAGVGMNILCRPPENSSVYQ